MLTTRSDSASSNATFPVAQTLVSTTAGVGQVQAVQTNHDTAFVPDELPRSYGQPVGASDTRVRAEHTAALSARLFAELWADVYTRAGESGANSIRQPYPLAERLQALARESGATQAEIAVTLQILSDGASEFAATAVHALGSPAPADAEGGAASIDARTLTALLQVAVNTARSSFFPQGVHTPAPTAQNAAGEPVPRWDAVAALTTRTLHAAWAGVAEALQLPADSSAPDDALQLRTKLVQAVLDDAVELTQNEYGITGAEREVAAQAIRSLLPILAEQLDAAFGARAAQALSGRGVSQVLNEALQGSLLFAGAADTHTVSAASVTPPSPSVTASVPVEQAATSPLENWHVYPIIGRWGEAFSKSAMGLPDMEALTAPLLDVRNGPPPLSQADFQAIGAALVSRMPGLANSMVDAMPNAASLSADERARVTSAVSARIDVVLRLTGAVPVTQQQHAVLLAASDLASKVRDLLTREGDGGLRTLFSYGDLGARLKAAAEAAAAQVQPDAAARVALVEGLRTDSAAIARDLLAQLPDTLLTAAQRGQLEKVLLAEAGLMLPGFALPQDQVQWTVFFLQHTTANTLQPLLQSTPPTASVDAFKNALQPRVATLLAMQPPVTDLASQIARAEFLQKIGAQFDATASQLSDRLMLMVPEGGSSPQNMMARALTGAALTDGIRQAVSAALAAATPKIPAFMLDANTRKLVDMLTDLYSQAVASGLSGVALDTAVRQKFMKRVYELNTEAWRTNETPGTLMREHAAAMVDYIAAAVAAQQGLNTAAANDMRQSLGIMLGYAGTVLSLNHSIVSDDLWQFVIAEGLWKPIQGAVRSGDPENLQKLLRATALQPNLQDYLKGYQGDTSKVAGYLQGLVTSLPLPEATRTQILQTLQAEREIMPAWLDLPDSSAGRLLRHLAPQLIEALRPHLIKAADGSVSLSSQGVEAYKDAFKRVLGSLDTQYSDAEAKEILRYVGSRGTQLADLALAYLNVSKPMSLTERSQLIDQLAGTARNAMKELGVEFRERTRFAFLAKFHSKDVWARMQEIMMESRDIMAKEHLALTQEMQGTTARMGLKQNIVQALQELIGFTAEDPTSDALIPYWDTTDDDDNPRNYYTRARELLVNMYVAYNQVEKSAAIDGLNAYWKHKGVIPVAMVPDDDPRIKDTGALVLNDLLLDRMNPAISAEKRLWGAAVFDDKRSGEIMGVEQIKAAIGGGYVFIQDRSLYTTVLNDRRTETKDDDRDNDEVLGLNFPVSVGSYAAYTREKATNVSEIFTSQIDQLAREQSIAATGVNDASNRMNSAMDAVRKLHKDLTELFSSIILGMR